MSIHMRLGRPTFGWVKLEIANITIDNISYINPYLVEDLCDWLIALRDGKDCTVDLDHEGHSTYLTCTKDQTIIIADDKTQHCDFVIPANVEQINEMMNEFAYNVRINIPFWAFWRDDDDEESQTQTANEIYTYLKRLE